MSANQIDNYFEFKCWKGLEQRGLLGNKEYEERLRFEIATITKMGFAGYFLIVYDFINWARSQDIPVGPGRGSVGGALVAYALGITNLDPIRFGLLFERFMNPDRVSMPDIDVDFCEKRRDEVLQYVIQKYGKDYVAQIGTFGTMKAKGAIRDVARTLGHPLLIASKLADLIPPPLHGKPISLAKSYDKVPELKNYHSDSSSPEGQILQWADKLENTIRSYGIHASGVVISPVLLHTIVPLATGSRGEQATQFEMNAVETAGLIKFDFLGLRTLTMIDLCCKLVERFHGKKIDIYNIPMDDEKVFQNLREGDTCGIFQFETSSGIRDLLIKIIPKDIEDIFALVAMYRPGPLGSDKIHMYLDVRAGRRQPEYAFPELEPVLKPTSGWLIYQESVMSIGRVLAGYSLAEADLVRRAVAKKKPEEMALIKPEFINRSIERGFDKKKVEEVFDEIDFFSAYGFNKAHAACYGYISYQTAYLKAHYPVEFMCAALTCDYGNVDKVIKYLAECKRLGISILPPDINQSESGFTVTTPTSKHKDGTIGSIRFGLSAIKYLGEEPVSHISAVRENGFTDILDFCNRVDLGKLNKRKLESLVLSGAFDMSPHTRSSMLATIDNLIAFRQEEKRYQAKMETYQKRSAAYYQREEDRTQGAKKAALKKPEPPAPPAAPAVPNIPEIGEQELLSKEKELLGFYISGHPLDAYSNILFSRQNLSTIDSLSEMKTGQKVEIAGLVSALQEKTTKKGDIMAFITMEDKTGVVDTVVFAAMYGKNKHLLTEGRPIVIRGEVEVTSINEEEDDGAVTVKLKVARVEPISHGEISNESINVRINPEHAGELEKLLKKYQGDACQVNVFLNTKNSLFKVNKVYSIGDNRSLFLRDLGRIT